MRKKKLKEQKIMGLLILVICGLLIALCAGGPTPEDRDITGAVLLAPLGLYMIFTNNIIIY